MHIIDVEFQSKAPHRTYWLRIDYNESNPPAAEMLVAFEQAGWEVDSPVPMCSNGDSTGLIGKSGTGIFNSWTEKELKANMKEARQILSQHGYDNVGVKDLELADML